MIITVCITYEYRYPKSSIVYKQCTSKVLNQLYLIIASLKKHQSEIYRIPIYTAMVMCGVFQFLILNFALLLTDSSDDPDCRWNRPLGFSFLRLLIFNFCMRCAGYTVL